MASIEVVEDECNMMELAVECCSNQNFDIVTSAEDQLMEPHSFDVVEYCNSSQVSLHNVSVDERAMDFDDQGICDEELIEAYEQYENDQRTIAMGKSF
jgi:hypothetical protein